MVRLVHLRPALLALAMLGLGAGALRADPIPQNVLDDNLKSCAQSCSASKPQTQCNAYCTCSIDSIEEKFTNAEYAALNSAVVARQPIPQGSSDKLQAIVNACKAKSFQ